jgi:hypothetical protein
MATIAAYEVNHLAVRLEDSGMSPRSAKAEAERIVGAIADEAYRKGFHDGLGATRATSIKDLLVDEAV